MHTNVTQKVPSIQNITYETVSVAGIKLYSDWRCIVTNGQGLHRFSRLLHCGEVNEGLWWFWYSDAHGLPDAVHAADVTWGHLTG